MYTEGMYVSVHHKKLFTLLFSHLPAEPCQQTEQALLVNSTRPKMLDNKCPLSLDNTQSARGPDRRRPTTAGSKVL